MELNGFFRSASSRLHNLEVWPIRTVFVCLLLACVAPAGQPQEPPPAGAVETEMVSGTIADLPPGRIVVNRAVIGKPAENRTFLITGETKVEGNLKTGARVTVGFKPSDEGDVAVRIIVRAAQARKP
jgi:hypothetical protein